MPLGGARSLQSRAARDRRRATGTPSNGDQREHRPGESDYFGTGAAAVTVTENRP